jgi:hypothetical protein
VVHSLARGRAPSSWEARGASRGTLPLDLDSDDIDVDCRKHACTLNDHDGGGETTASTCSHGIYSSIVGVVVIVVVAAVSGRHVTAMVT